MELSTIVEIVRNYKPSLMPLLGNASTTVEIMRHTSHIRVKLNDKFIYNSRNY